MYLENKKFFIIIFFHFFITSKAQQPFKAPEAPRTFEYTKYDQIPAGEYTGVPNIGIPLYNIKTDGIDVPLNLQYHAGGVRVNEEASYVGLGWNLNFGIITQTINGKDDLLDSSERIKQKLIYQNSPLISQWPITCGVFSNSSFYCNPSGIVENYFSNINGKPLETDFNSMFIATGPVLPHTGIGVPIVGSPYGIKDEPYQDYRSDFEPDIFRVAFFGHSLKFMLNFDSPNDEIVVLDNQGYKIQRNFYLAGSYGWNITTPEGVQYFFSNMKKESSGSAGSLIDPEGSYDNSSFGSSSYTNKWFLTKIITLNNKVINFNYIDYGISYAKSYDQKFRKIKVNMQNVAFQYFFGLYKGLGIYDSPASSEMTQTTFNTISESVLYPSSIESDEAKVYFSYSDRLDRENDKKLDKVIIRNLNSTIVKEYTFLYDYFISANMGNTILNSNNVFNSTSRLKLVSLQETGSNAYQFQYDPIVLPQKNSTAVDFWGFYNGKTNNTSTAPNPTQLGFTDMGNNNNDNAANINYSNACTLKEIIYPTGGKSNYEYELNEFEKGPDDTALPNADSTIGTIIKGYGNRIKNISLSDGGIIRKNTNYYYSGGKSIVPFQLNYSYSQNEGYMGGCGNADAVFCTQSLTINDFQSNNYYRPALFSAINTVGYNTVTVEEISYGMTNGKRVIQFSNNRAIKPSPVMDYQNFLVLPARENINFVDNGKIISEALFDNNSFKIKETTNNYLINKSNIYYSTKISGFRTLYGTTNILTIQSVPQFLVGYYLIYDKHSLLSKETITDFFPTGSITNKVDYSYNDNNQITGLIKSNSVSGQFYEERTYYAVTPSSIVQKNILNLPSTKVVLTNNNVKEQFNYTYEDSSNTIVLKKIGVYPQGNPDPAKTKSVFYDTYDTNGNLVEFHSDNDIHTCIIWGYNKTQPIAKIENAAYSSIPAATIIDLQTKSDADIDSASEATLAVALNALRTSLPSAFVTTYTYNPLIGVTSITDPKGLTSYYEYDSFNRLKFIKDQDQNILQRNCYNYKGQVIDCSQIVPIVPIAPTGLALSSATTSTLNFTWTAVSGATGYKIYKNGVYVSSTTAPSGSLTGLTSSTAYGVQVLSFNALVDGALCSTVSMTTTAASSDTTAPSTPITSSSKTSIPTVIINWTASTDNVGVTGYQLWRDVNTTGTFSLIATPTTSPYTDVAVIAGEGNFYSYKMRARDAAGNWSAYSAVKSQVVP